MSNIESKKNMIDTIFIANKDNNPYIAKVVIAWKNEEETKGNCTEPLIKGDGSHWRNCECLICWLSRKSDAELKSLGSIYKFETQICSGNHKSYTVCQCHQKYINEPFGVLNYGWCLCDNRYCSYCYSMFQGQL